MKVIFILGNAGSGKDTQADLLSDHLGFAQINVGQILRESVNSDDDSYQILSESKMIALSGQMAPAEPIGEIVLNQARKLIQEGESVIFNGFPSMIEHLEKVESWLAENDQLEPSFIYLSVPINECFSRIIARSADSNRFGRSNRSLG
ncbi:nucleoside monophosphate kinase [Candidatus Berkelbacteria bacterium]|nr:nucleoside monophosphate kinase [Candidatus Berkelbacteria bacterium]